MNIYQTSNENKHMNILRNTNLSGAPFGSYGQSGWKKLSRRQAEKGRTRVEGQPKVPKPNPNISIHNVLIFKFYITKLHTFVI